MITLWRNEEIISRFDFSAVKSTHMYCKMGVRDKFRVQWVAKSTSNYYWRRWEAYIVRRSMHWCQDNVPKNLIRLPYVHIGEDNFQNYF